MKKLLFYSLIITLCCGFSCKSHKYDNLPTQLAELCKKIDKSPKNSDLYQLRAEYYYQNNNTDEALNDILYAIKLNDKKSSYYITLADIYLAKRETDLVEDMLKKAIAVDKNNEAYLKLAELYLYQYMYEECEEIIETAIRQQNHNPKAYLTKALLLEAYGDTVGFIRMLQLVIDQDPREVIAYNALGNFFQEMNDPLAISYYKNALEITPNDKLLNYSLGKLYQDLGELDLAKEQYRNLITIDPYSYPAYNNLGYIAFYFEDNYEEAVRLYSKAIEVNPAYYQAWFNRGLAYEWMDDYKNARNDYQQSLSINPNYEKAIKNLNNLDAHKQ
ncbi:MAG: tetratricopeptide repeat protein [Bacteroidales bacterium]|jgi:tetratricopeptide (TPR) repeat protein|nr:tetratricopeptide repeat protein [Bacteroidales bacterium]